MPRFVEDSRNLAPELGRLSGVVLDREPGLLKLGLGPTSLNPHTLPVMFSALRTAVRATAGRRLFATAACSTLRSRFVEDSRNLAPELGRLSGVVLDREPGLLEFEQTRLAIEHHAAQSAELWRKIT
jgi:hypothetical protein